MGTSCVAVWTSMDRALYPHCDIVWIRIDADHTRADTQKCCDTICTQPCIQCALYPDPIRTSEQSPCVDRHCACTSNPHLGNDCHPPLSPMGDLYQYPLSCVGIFCNHSPNGHHLPQLVTTKRPHMGSFCCYSSALLFIGRACLFPRV